MARDQLRLVVFTAPAYEAARPYVLADFTAPPRYLAEGGSPQLAPGEHETGNITYDSAYAGEFSTLDRHRNSRLTFVLRTLAADPVADVDALVAASLAAPPRSAVEWKRDSYPAVYFPLRGDVNWTPLYSVRERSQGGGMLVTLGFEVAPFVHHGSLDIYDGFEMDSLADYKADA